jgi:hypothetical protein
MQPIPVAARSKAPTARLLGLWVRISPTTWMSVESVVLPGIGPCVGPITRPEVSYRVCVCVCVIDSDQVQQ